MENRSDFSTMMLWRHRQIQDEHRPAHTNTRPQVPSGSATRYLSPAVETAAQPATFLPATTHGESDVIVRERQRIAHEIHDGVAQDLAALSLKLRQCHGQIENDPTTLDAELDDIRTVLDGTIVELRRIIHGLRPVSLEEQGFIPALHALAAEFGSQYALYVHLRIDGTGRYLPRALELPLFRMAQEALNNVVQHARATCVQITLSRTARTLTFSIEDNGCGFGGEQMRPGHLGIRQMDERINAHGGTLSIQSGVGRGTRLVATFFPAEPNNPGNYRKE